MLLPDLYLLPLVLTEQAGAQLAGSPWAQEWSVGGSPLTGARSRMPSASLCHACLVLSSSTNVLGILALVRSKLGKGQNAQSNRDTVAIGDNLMLLFSN